MVPFSLLGGGGAGEDRLDLILGVLWVVLECGWDEGGHLSLPGHVVRSHARGTERLLDGVRSGLEGVETPLVLLGLDVVAERLRVDEVFPVKKKRKITFHH